MCFFVVVVGNVVVVGTQINLILKHCFCVVQKTLPTNLSICWPTDQKFDQQQRKRAQQQQNPLNFVVNIVVRSEEHNDNVTTTRDQKSAHTSNSHFKKGIFVTFATTFAETL